MAKDLYITLLFDFYHNMLTDKQAEVIDLYNEDLSLAEKVNIFVSPAKGLETALSAQK